MRKLKSLNGKIIAPNYRIGDIVFIRFPFNNNGAITKIIADKGKGSNFSYVVRNFSNGQEYKMPETMLANVTHEVGVLQSGTAVHTKK